MAETNSNILPENQLVREHSAQMERDLQEIEEARKKIFAKAFIQQETSNYEEGIEEAQKIPFSLLFALALASDFADPITVVGTLVKIITLPILWYNFYIKNTRVPGLPEKYQVEVSWKIRFLFRILGIADLIPFLNALPLTTISVIFIWYQTNKKIEEKKREMEEVG